MPHVPVAALRPPRLLPIAVLGSAVPVVAAVVVAALVVATLVVAASPAAAATPPETEHALIGLVAAERAARGVPALAVDDRLVAAARDWTVAMAARGGLSHSGGSLALPPGVVVWAENVGRTTQADAAASLHGAFMGSAQHRDNILDPRFTAVGIGVVVHGDTTWVTQVFTDGLVPVPTPTQEPVEPAPAPDAPVDAPAPAPAPAPEPTAAVVPLARAAEAAFGGQSARHAVLARDDTFPDALAAGPLAGNGGPLLLTPPGAGLHPDVRRALERTVPLGATVYLVGGEAALSAGVEAEVRAAGWTPHRVAGGDRITTAVAVAAEVAALHGSPDTVLLATADDWPDAAAAGAYGAEVGAPVLLTEPDALPPATAGALAALRPRRVAALGGRAVLSDAVVAAAGAERVAGATREETAADVAEALWGRKRATAGETWIAVPGSGEGAWGWALGVAPYAARHDAPVLLVREPADPALLGYLDGLGYGGAVTGRLEVLGPVADAAADALTAVLS